MQFLVRFIQIRIVKPNSLFPLLRISLSHGKHWQKKAKIVHFHGIFYFEFPILFQYALFDVSKILFQFSKRSKKNKIAQEKHKHTHNYLSYSLGKIVSINLLLWNNVYDMTIQSNGPKKEMYECVLLCFSVSFVLGSLCFFWAVAFNRKWQIGPKVNNKMRIVCYARKDCDNTSKARFCRRQKNQRRKQYICDWKLLRVLCSWERLSWPMNICKWTFKWKRFPSFCQSRRTQRANGESRREKERETWMCTNKRDHGSFARAKPYRSCNFNWLSVLQLGPFLLCALRSGPFIPFLLCFLTIRFSFGLTSSWTEKCKLIGHTIGPSFDWNNSRG